MLAFNVSFDSRLTVSDFWVVVVIILSLAYQGPAPLALLRLSLSSNFFFLNRSSHILWYIVLYCYVFALLIPIMYAVHDNIFFMRVASHHAAWAAKASVAKFAALFSSHSSTKSGADMVQMQER